MKTQKEKIKVFTNGCFDLLHIGHITLLNRIKEIFPISILTVGINSDNSIKQLKGDTRPIYPEYIRKEMLLSLKAVDDVIIFDTPTPAVLIQSLNPDVIVKGEEYFDKQIVGIENAKAYTIIPHIVDISTSEVISLIKNDQKFST